MQAKTLKLVAIGLVSLSIVLAVVGIRLSRNTAPPLRQQAESSALPGHRMVVAARNLTPGEILKADDVSIVSVSFPVENTFSDGAMLVGRTIRKSVAKAGVISENTFDAGGKLARDTGHGMRAMAIHVDEIAGVGGFVQPGDRVDVFYTMHTSGMTGNQSLAGPLVRNVRVLAYGNDIAEQNPATAAKDGGNGKNSRSAVLEVNPLDVSRLLLAETNGVLRLAVIGTDGDEKSHSDINAQADASVVSLTDINGVSKSRRRQDHIEIYQGDQIRVTAANGTELEAAHHDY